MISRGMRAPTFDVRKPVSMMCEISVLISMMSPRLAFGGNIDERAGHQSVASTQAASVTITSAMSDQNEPSLISAMATTFCASASRMRVEKRPCRHAARA